MQKVGLHCSAILIRNKTIEDVGNLLPEPFVLCELQLDWAGASSQQLYPNAAVAEIPDWTVIWTPNDRLALFTSILKDSSIGGVAASFIFSSVNNLYGYSLYEDGVHKRTLLYHNGHAIKDEGSMLPQESDIDWQRDHESNTFELSRRVCGVDLGDCESWQKLSYRLIERG